MKRTQPPAHRIERPPRPHTRDSRSHCFSPPPPPPRPRPRQLLPFAQNCGPVCVGSSDSAPTPSLLLLPGPSPVLRRPLPGHLPAGSRFRPLPLGRTASSTSRERPRKRGLVLVIRESWWLVSHGKRRAFDERSHKTFETVAAESGRADSQNTNAAPLQCDRSFCIGCGSIGVVMHVTIDLETGANLGAVRRPPGTSPLFRGRLRRVRLARRPRGRGRNRASLAHWPGRGLRSCSSVLPTPNDSFGQRAAQAGAGCESSGACSKQVFARTRNRCASSADSAL